MIVLSISVNNIYENIPDPAYVYMCQVAMCRENWYLIVTFIVFFYPIKYFKFGLHSSRCIFGQACWLHSSNTNSSSFSKWSQDWVILYF